MGLDIFITKRKEINLAYYRKVNFLVKFFQDREFDVENQTPLRIYKGDIEELLNCCNKVLNDHSKAPELLPTMDGFFFGSTDYNEYYFNSVERVRNDCIKLLDEFDSLDEDESIYFETWF